MVVLGFRVGSGRVWKRSEWLRVAERSPNHDSEGKYSLMRVRVRIETDTKPVPISADAVI